MKDYGNRKFYLQTFDRSLDGVEALYPRKDIILNEYIGDFCIGVNDNLEYIYRVPRSVLELDLVEGNDYSFMLVQKDDDGMVKTRYAKIDFTVGVVSAEDKLQNSQDITNDKLDEQNKKLDEQNKTSKNIFEKIGEIFNILNPFSKDFFAYKLVSLFLEMLKSLFIPSDDFFTNWIDDLNEYFKDTFGILYYPFSLLIEFLNKISSLNDSTTAIMKINDIKIFDTTLISGFTYNFNDLLSNDTFKNVHDIYLGIVDVILWLGLVYICRGFIKFIFGGIDDVYDDITADETSYQRYSQYQDNKKRYKEEHSNKRRNVK